MIPEKAQELGRLIGQSEDYKALRRARQRLDEVPELAEKIDQLSRLAEGMERKVAQGEEPSQEDVSAYERLLREIEADARYQGVVAAQTNFDKLMLRVNQQILEGLKKGSESPIITLG